MKYLAKYMFSVCRTFHAYMSKHTMFTVYSSSQLTPHSSHLIARQLRSQLTAYTSELTAQQPLIAHSLAAHSLAAHSSQVKVRSQLTPHRLTGLTGHSSQLTASQLRAHSS
jgi:hypothetical protein